MPPDRFENPGEPAGDLSVLVPVFNEAQTVAAVLQRLLRLPGLREVVVVDDGSTDGTAEALAGIQDPRLVRLRHECNRGKTAAIATAAAAANGAVVIVQDADLEYDPEEIPAVIAPILAGQADVVYGSRFLVRRAARVLYFNHYLGNRFLTFLSNLFTNLNMTDMETCYKAFRTPILRHLPLRSRGFGMEVEITAMISRLPLRIYEVPISYYGRTYSEGKKIRPADGLAALWYVLYFNLVGVRLPRSRRYRARVRAELGLEEGRR